MRKGQRLTDSLFIAAIGTATLALMFLVAVGVLYFPDVAQGVITLLIMVIFPVWQCGSSRKEVQREPLRRLNRRLDDR